MRNDVKLGLAVGGLLLIIVLAYALFFSNNNKDRDRESIASRIGSSEDQQRPPPGGNADQTPAGNSNNRTDTSPPVNTQNVTEHAAPPVADNANPLSGRTWTALLNEGATGALGPSIITPRDPPTNIATPPSRETTNTVTGSGTATTTADPVRASGPRKYTVKSGDSFWSIAKAEYGNAAYFGHIQRANPGVDPQRLKAGTTITLPERTEVIAPAHDAPAAAAATEAPAIDPAKQYKVQTGDNLSNIAKRLYGRYDKWTAIYRLNEDLIGPNPAVLKRDMILRLPEPPLAVAGTTIQ